MLSLIDVLGVLLMPGTFLKTLINMQPQIVQFRQMAASGEFAPAVAKRLRNRADDVEAAVRMIGTEDRNRLISLTTLLDRA
jgi:hypothetical protein